MELSTQKNEEQIQNMEGLLKTFKLLKESETLYDLFTKPYTDILSIHEQMFKHQRDFLKPIPGKQNDRLLFYLLFLISYSDTLYTIEVNSETSEVTKANINLIRKEIGNIIIKEANPYLIYLFKWDLDRRNWKHDKDRMAFLQKTINDLNEEINGNRNNLVKKYIRLILDFFASNLDIILSQFKDKEFEKTKIVKEDAFKMRNQLQAFLKSNRINEVIDNGIESNVLEFYKNVAQSHFEGLLISTNRYDYLIAAFIEAQNDYKNIVTGILKSLQENDINSLKSALKNKDIAKFISLLHPIFASVPNNLLKNTNEAYYHINLHVILKAIGCEIVSEISTNLGRIDSVIEFDDFLYIIEYKLTESSEALNQIERKKYYESYLNKNKQIFLLGLSFDVTNRNIKKDYSLTELKELV